MNLYELRKKIEFGERAVITLNEFSKFLQKSRNISAVYANRMRKRGLLFKTEKNKYSTTNDVFVVASQLVYPSYIGLTSALYLHNLLPQTINHIYVMSSVRKKSKNILGSKIIFIKVNPKLVFGYKREKKENSFIFISDIEKTIIDCLLYPNYCRVNVLINALKSSDIKKLEEYNKLVNKEVITRKIGFLLDFLNISHSLRKKTKSNYKLNPLIKSKGKFNNKWGLYINEVLE